MLKILISVIFTTVLVSPLVAQTEENFKFKQVALEALKFLAIQHSTRLLTGDVTKDHLKGPFIKDYLNSVGALKNPHWNDGGKFRTNYIFHPMEGAVYGYTHINNSSAELQVFSMSSKKYWKSRAKAMAWSAVWSTQFEIGPISEASIGNVGLQNPKKMAVVDFVITPTLGTAWIVGEDAADKYIYSWIDEKTNKKYILNISRSLLTPTKSFSNILRGKVPWYRRK